MPFSDLPNEVIFELADRMRDREVNSLARTCQSLHRLLNVYLYTRDAKTGHPEALRWAIENVEVATAKLSLDVCPDINQIVSRRGVLPTWDPPMLLAIERWQSVLGRVHAWAACFNKLRQKSAGAHISMVRLLLERGAKMRYEDTQYLLVIACRSGLPELAQLVFDNSAHLGEKGREIGHVVVNAAVDANCSTEVIRLLLDNYAVPPDHFYLPSIVDKGHTAAARLLLERGVDANQEDNIGLTPLHGMLLQSRLSGDVNLEMVRLLVENGAEVNSRRGPIPLLVCALMLENDSLTSYLLKSGADIHWKDESELSLLHHAVITRCTLENLRYVIHKLVDLGVDREARDLNGLTALHRAISGSSLDKVSTLIQLPVDVNALTGSGAAPLHLAASSWRKPSLVQMLVKAGADINMRQQSDGYTPLHVATYCGNSQMLGQLLKCGADPSMRDHSGKTPLDIFEEFKEKRKLPNGLGSALRRKLSPPQPRAGKSPREPANKSVLLPRNTRTSARLRGKDAADDDKATERPAKRARVPKK